MPTRQIYLLSPKQLSPETIAVAFAKTSRSPETFRQIASDLSDESSAKFHEKWVVGYGHASVAEHAVLHIAIENVSRLAVECIESNRLASYTEKSTRYQKWDKDHFYIPPELDEHPLRDVYIKTCSMLFETYLQSLIPTRALVEKQVARKEIEGEEAFDRRIRSQYVDSCRFLLPAASLANLGMTANARILEHAICKMLSHPLEEVRQIGEMVKQVAQVEVPTLVKYANAAPYLVETSRALGNWTLNPTSEGNLDWCSLVAFDPAGEDKVMAAALYRFGEMSYKAARKAISMLSGEQKEEFARELLGRLTEYDKPLRELEHITFTFDIILDQGGYAELKRHRMMTQTPQSLTARLGFAVPQRIMEAGFERSYRSAMEKAIEVYEKIASWNPDVASYVVPNGFNRRVLITMNLREAFAFCQLRSAPNAHFSIRRVAECMAEQIRQVQPLLGKYIPSPKETWKDVEKGSFSQV